MNAVFKNIALFLTVIILLCSVTACSGQENVELTEQGKNVIVSGNVVIDCDYLLIYPQGSSDSDVNIYIDVLKYMTDNSSYKFQLIPDSIAVNDPAQKTILLGNTVYAQSEQVIDILRKVRLDSFYDYIFKTYDNCLAVGWQSRAGRNGALNYLKKSLVSEIDNFFDEDFSYMFFDGNNEYSTILINERNITDYKIVIPSVCSYMVRYYSEQLAQSIKNATGKAVPVVTDLQDETDNEILIGATNRIASQKSYFFAEAKYAIVETNGKLVINGGQVYSIAQAVKTFIAMLDDSAKASIPLNITKDYFRLGNSDLEEAEYYDGYKLVFADEFGSKSVDGRRWSVYDGIVLYGNGKMRNFSYSYDNVEIKNNSLLMNCDLSLDGYSGSLIDSKDKMSFQYGYIEVAARFPMSDSIWSRVWLTPVNKSLSTVPEIGIFNCFGGQNTVFASATNVATADFEKNKYNMYQDGAKSASAYKLTTDSDFENDYHIFAVEWNDRYIVFYCDGIEYYRYEINNARADFKNEMYLSAMIGCQLNGTTIDDSIVNWPCQLDIDYIHIYQHSNAVNIKIN